MFDTPRDAHPSVGPALGEADPRDAAGFDRALAEGTPGRASLELLLDVDPSSLDRADGVSVLIGIEKAMRLLAALALQVQVVVAGTWPGGEKMDEAVHEVAVALNLHPSTAGAKVATARGVVGRLPMTLKRLEAGELSLAQVQKIERAVRGLDVTVAQAVEADAVPGSVRGLGRRLETALARRAPEALARRTQERRSRREVTSWTDAVEGLAGLAVQGPVEMIAEIKSAIDLDARLRVAGECRSLNVRRFDVLREWARDRLGLVPLHTPPTKPTTTDAQPSGETPAEESPGEPMGGRRRKRRRRRGGSPRPAHRRCGTCGRAGPNRIPINVTVSLETLLRLSDTAGELDGAPIPAEVARELAHDGDWMKWVVESGGGRFLWAGAKTYRPGRRLARHVRGRDVTCRFPSCRRPASECDLDHVRAFHTEGGTTVAGNLGDLCPTHHALKHDESGWSYALPPEGTARWTSPCGRVYDDPPQHHDDDPALNAYLAAGTERRRARDSARERRIARKTRKLSDVFAAWDTPPAGQREDLPF